MTTQINGIKNLLLASTVLSFLGCGGDGYNSSNNSEGSYTENNINNYRTVQIGSQKWMAENLNYYVIGSKCYNNNPANCKKYGRLYDWKTAMKVCPYGWHLPSRSEWDALASFIESDRGCSYCDARHLKATSGWFDNGNGTDTYGFTALPGGRGYSGGYFYGVDSNSYWWSASENRASNACRRIMYYYYEYANWYYFNKMFLFSVRCVKD